MTLATLPISPSSLGITSIATRACPPGGSEPSIQARSPAGPVLAGFTGLAGLEGGSAMPAYEPLATPAPEHRRPKKNWRLKRGATPQWYKQRHGIRAKAQSGAARVARFRPRPR